MKKVLRNALSVGLISLMVDSAAYAASVSYSCSASWPNTVVVQGELSLFECTGQNGRRLLTPNQNCNEAGQVSRREVNGYDISMGLRFSAAPPRNGLYALELFYLQSYGSSTGGFTVAGHQGTSYVANESRHIIASNAFHCEVTFHLAPPQVAPESLDSLGEAVIQLP